MTNWNSQFEDDKKKKRIDWNTYVDEGLSRQKEEQQKQEETQKIKSENDAKLKKSFTQKLAYGAGEVGSKIGSLFKTGAPEDASRAEKNWNLVSKVVGAPNSKTYGLSKADKEGYYNKLEEARKPIQPKGWTGSDEEYNKMAIFAQENLKEIEKQRLELEMEAQRINQSAIPAVTQQLDNALKPKGFKPNEFKPKTLQPKTLGQSSQTKPKEVKSEEKDISARINELKDAEQNYKEFLGWVENDRGVVSGLLGEFDSVDDVIQKVPFAGTAVEAAETMRDVDILKRYKNDPASLDDLDLARVQTIQSEVMTNMLKKDMGSSVGKMLAQMPTFLIEFALTAGVFKAGESATKAGLLKLGKSTVEDFSSNLVSSLVGSAARTSVFIPMISNETANYMLPTQGIIESKEGQLAFAQIDEGDAFKKALPKGIATTYVNLATEDLGKFIEEPERLVKNAFLNKFALGRGITESTTFAKALKTAGWNGIVGEVLEEEGTELLQSGIEQRKYNAPLVTPQGTERFITETLGIVAFAGIAKIPDYSIQQLEKTMPQREKAMIQAEKVIEIDPKIEALTSERPNNTLLQEAETILNDPTKFGEEGIARLEQIRNELPDNEKTNVLQEDIDKARDSLGTSQDTLRQKMVDEGGKKHSLRPEDVLKTKTETTGNAGELGVNIEQEQPEDKKAELSNQVQNEKNTAQIKKDTLEGKREEFRMNTPKMIDNYIQKGATAEDTVLVYKATEGNSIVEGDYVTISEEKAQDYTKQGKGNVVSMEAKVGDLVYGNGLRSEFIYAPTEAVTPPKGTEAQKTTDSLAEEARKYKSAEEFYNARALSDGFRNAGIRGREQFTNFWEKATRGVDKTPVIDSTNPTGGVFVDYSPESRVTAQLADNMTTLAETTNKSPEEMITVYRGAPKSQRVIVPGDFITTDYNSAKSYIGNDGVVLEKEVRLGDILDDAEDPVRGDYIYRPGADGQVKPRPSDIYNQAKAETKEKPTQKKETTTKKVVATAVTSRTSKARPTPSQMGRVVQELQASEAGKRIRTDEGEWIRKPSTFPDWISSDDLRSRELIDKVLGYINSGKEPPLRFGKIRALYDMALEEAQTREADTKLDKEITAEAKKNAPKKIATFEVGEQIDSKTKKAASIKPVESEGEILKSSAYQKVKGRLEDIVDDDPTYNKLNLAEDAAKAVEFVRRYPNRAKRIALGMEIAPPGITDTAISLVYAEVQGQRGNYLEQAMAEKARSWRQTRRGQEIVAEKGRINENSAEYFVRQVLQARKDLLAKSWKLPDYAKKSKGKATTGVSERIKTDAVKLKAEIDTKVLKDLGSAQKFIDSITC